MVFVPILLVSYHLTVHLPNIIEQYSPLHFTCSGFRCPGGRTSDALSAETSKSDISRGRLRGNSGAGEEGMYRGGQGVVQGRRVMGECGVVKLV